MHILMKDTADHAQVEGVLAHLRRRGLDGQVSETAGRFAVAVVGDSRGLCTRDIKLLAGVQDAIRLTVPWTLAARAVQQQGSEVSLGGGVTVGGGTLVLMAGPCAIESAEQIDTAARAVARAGATVLRGGAFKPRTSPYSFQGLGEAGLKLLREAASWHGLRAVSEVMDASQIGLVSEYVDLLQVGARNMQNFTLLKALAKARLPVLLKRAPSATLEEWLLAAEYLLSGGNGSVILCERGIRTFETAARNTLDLSAVAALRALTHLPVVVDPSHGTGSRDQVTPMARAAVAVGADGLLVEVHPAPETALSDGAQSLSPERFDELVGQIRPIAAALGRSLG